MGDPGCPSGTSSAPENISSSMHCGTLPGAPGSPTSPIRFGCDSRTGRDRELEVDIFDPASLALVQQCDIPHVVRSANNGAYSAYGY